MKAKQPKTMSRTVWIGVKHGKPEVQTAVTDAPKAHHGVILCFRSEQAANVACVHVRKATLTYEK